MRRGDAMTELSRRKAIQTAGAAALAVPFAVPPNNFPRSAQPDPLLALEAQRVEAENAADGASSGTVEALFLFL